jgi:hypothetical protein
MAHYQEIIGGKNSKPGLEQYPQDLSTKIMSTKLFLFLG